MRKPFEILAVFSRWGKADRKGGLTVPAPGGDGSAVELHDLPGGLSECGNYKYLLSAVFIAGSISSMILICCVLHVSSE